MVHKSDKGTKGLENFVLELYRKALSLKDKELYEYFLDHAVNITKSEIGFFHFVSDDQKTIGLTMWNSKALQNCTANFDDHYPLEKAGNWADCVRQKRPLIYNDFAKSPNQKGLPSGHSPVRRMLSVPIIEEDKVYAIFGVGNKVKPYYQKDLNHLNLVAYELNKIMKQRKAEFEIKFSEVRFRSLYDNSLDGVLLTHPNGIILSANPSASRMFGMSEDEIKSVGRAGIVVNDSRLIAALEERERTGKVHAELTFRRKDGSTFEGEVTSSIFVDVDGSSKTSMIIRDISERKKLQNKVEEHTKNLELLVEQRTKQLKDAERLAAIGATAGMVGHDIRNPLQAIVSDVYLLKDYLVNMPDIPTKRDAIESLDGIEKNISYINKIVADLQDYAKPLRPNLEEVNLYALVTSVFHTVALPDNISISIDIPPCLSCKSDSTLLMRVLTNLVINAIQAMPDGGKLSINGYSHNGTMLIIVEDTGVGIPEEIKPKVFTPMVTSKSKGQGLGLAVVKKLVETLKGTVGFESQEGKGTKFIIKLPLT